MFRKNTYYLNLTERLAKLILFPVVIFMMMLNQVQAWQVQSLQVRAKVVDENKEPLLGVTVRIKNTKRVYKTNQKGIFIIENADPHDIVAFKCIGFKVKEVSIKEILRNPVILLQPDIASLNEITITKQKVVGTQIDLKHRSHQTLAGVLEGGVPGLVLKRGTKTTTGPKQVYNGQGAFSLQELYQSSAKYQYDSFEEFEKAVNEGRDERWIYNPNDPGNPGQKYQYKSKTTTTNNGVVAELRGSSSFSGGTAGMLVVIDGFIIDEFPENYPMNNVASIEVIKDPVECIKWGPAGAAGVIIITTNLANPGQLQINYNSNFYFSPRPDISAEKLRLANSADLLDYYKEVYDKKISSYISEYSTQMPPLLSPAEMLLFNLHTKKIDPDRFQHKWDSLSTISNRGQLRLLQQNAFNQNHSLAVSGGTRRFRFMLGGVYGTERSNVLGESNKRFGLNLKNDISLLGDKLKIKWIADLTRSRSITRRGGEASTLDPYQLLVDEHGSYVYNYTTITPDINTSMLSSGYFDNGSNLLEDIIGNSYQNKSLRINSSLNLEWKLMRSLQWVTSLRYSRSSGNIEDLYDKTTSQSRELINNYGSPSFDALGPAVDFYVPVGGTLKKSTTKNNEYNIRSGFNFNHIFSADHQLTATVDGGLSNLENRIRPAIAIYGYDKNKPNGLPIMASSKPSIINYQGSSVDLDQLLTPGINGNVYSRSISLNGTFLYSFRSRYSVDAKYSATFVPDFGGNPPYSTTSNRSVSASWQVNKEDFFKVGWISNLKLSVSATEMQVARLPRSQISATRVFQPLWSNNAINVHSYNLSQQSGQKNRNFSGQLDAGFSEGRIQLNLDYGRNSINGNSQLNARLFYDIAKEPYFNFPLISTLQADITLQDLNSFQGLGIMMNSSSLSSGGGFSMPGSNSLGLLPPDVLNKETHLQIGLVKDRFLLDLRHYHRTTSGLVNGNLPTDPATGLDSRVNYSKTVNKGIEISLRTEIIKSKTFDWSITANGAYNVNEAVDVPPVNFSLTPAYLTAFRNGYSIDNLWNYKWAGLDNLGNPQVYNKDMQKVAEPDSLSLVYVGRTTPPWSGALIQECRYKGFFASARLIFNLGHIMRKYMPVLNSDKDNSVAIRDRWRKPGDEAFKEVAAVAQNNPTRELIIRWSDNAVIPADHVRLREIQFGYDVPPSMLKGKFFKALTLSVQVQNVALWTKNDFKLDPEIVSNTGIVGISPPRNYVLSINIGL